MHLIHNGQNIGVGHAKIVVNHGQLVLHHIADCFMRITEEDEAFSCLQWDECFIGTSESSFETFSFFILERYTGNVNPASLQMSQKDWVLIFLNQSISIPIKEIHLLGAIISKQIFVVVKEKLALHM